MSVLWIVFLVLTGLILLLGLASAFGYSRFRAGMEKEAAVLFKNRNVEKKGIVTEKDLKGLPAPVRKFLEYTQIVGKERIQTVRLKMKGKMRLRPGQRWFRLKAEEYYTTGPPSLVWLGKISPFPLFSVTARDRYSAGEGNMKIKILSMFSLADAGGKEMDEAAMVRYLNEMMWFPTAYLSDYVKWEPIDDCSARICMSEKGISVSAVFVFNDKGEMVDFMADRFNSESGQKEEWHTPIYEYGKFHGIWIPIKGEDLYRRSSGDFS